MTTYEHAMVGICGALAARLDERHGWQIVAMAAVAANSPDWDGLTLVLGANWFDMAHRAWGHNVFATLLIGALIGFSDYRRDWTTRIARRIFQTFRWPPPPPSSRSFRWTDASVWISVGILAAFSHLAADLVVSGTASLGDWKLQLLWPFSNRGWIFPAIRWGDPTPTLLFAAGMLALARWPHRRQRTAILTLIAVAGYIVVRAVR